MFVALLDSENICIGIRETYEKTSENLQACEMEIDSYNLEFLGKKFDNGEWLEVEKINDLSNQDELPEDDVSFIKTLEILQENIKQERLLNMEIQAEMMEMILKNN